MANTLVYNQNGAEVSNVELNPAVFGIEVNQQSVFDAVIMQRASMRQGTHDTKNRREVSGGGRKPWRQKGTGRARQGSIRAVQWRGGGIAFGPTPRSYSYRINRKVRRLALKSVLTEKVNENAVYVVDGIKFEAPKTKEFVKFMDAFKIEKSVMVVVENSYDNENLFLAARNLGNVLVLFANEINVYDLLACDKVIFTQAAIKDIEEVLA